MKAIARLRVVADAGGYEEVRDAFAAAGFPVVKKKVDVHWKWAPEESLKGFVAKFGAIKGENFQGEQSDEDKAAMASVTKMITGVMKKCGWKPWSYKGRKMFPGNAEGSKRFRVDHAFGWAMEHPKKNLHVIINYAGGYEERGR